MSASGSLPPRLRQLGSASDRRRRPGQVQCIDTDPGAGACRIFCVSRGSRRPFVIVLSIVSVSGSDGNAVRDRDGDAFVAAFQPRLRCPAVLFRDQPVAVDVATGDIPESEVEKLCCCLVAGEWPRFFVIFRSWKLTDSMALVVSIPFLMAESNMRNGTKLSQARSHAATIPGLFFPKSRRRFSRAVFAAASLRAARRAASRRRPSCALSTTRTSSTTG